MKILILKPSSLGDVIHALPVLRLLKQHLPGSEIYWWLDSQLLPLLEGDPDLAGIIPFHRQRWGSPLYLPEVWQSLQALRRHQFDWVIDLQSLLRSAVAAWLTNGKFTIGLDDPREGAGAFYDVAVPRPSAGTHAVDWYLTVLPHLGVPVHSNFEWMPTRPGVSENIRQKWAIPNDRWVALQPGARWMNKRWPAEHFAELVRLALQEYPDLRFVILGSNSNADLGAVISAAAPARCLDLTGTTSLPEMIEWIRLSEVMVTNDTGPMHVAAALRKPVIALFGPTNARRTGPYGQLEHVLQIPLPCVPCMKSKCTWAEPLACLRGLTPDSVFQRLQAGLRNGNGRAENSHFRAAQG